MRDSSTILDFSKSLSMRPRRLRVRAFANLSDWVFIVADYLTRQPIGRDFGELPPAFTFDESTATLYALACAHRWITCNAPGAVVSLVNCAAPSPRRESRTERRAA